VVHAVVGSAVSSFAASENTQSTVISVFPCALAIAAVTATKNAIARVRIGNLP
jgi:hypothetical protein